MVKKTPDKLSDEALEKKHLCENDLVSFVNFVQPRSVLGNCHIDLINWLNREEAKTHQLVLLPRDHRKSTILAYRLAQAITKDPTLRILLISSTSNLATKQLK